MKFAPIFLLLCCYLFGCNESSTKNSTEVVTQQSFTPVKQTSIVILGTIQDAGSPHIGCTKDCCAALFENPDPKRQGVSLGIVDVDHQKTFLFEATPDIARQAKALKEFAPFSAQETPDAVFLTHAHIGHYTGLMYFGREARNTNRVPVYAMPRMKTFLEEHGPWSQWVSLENIALNAMHPGQPYQPRVERK